MKLGFIVSAYKRPDLLRCLLAALAPAPCAIHLDAKSDDSEFAGLADLPGDITMLPRHVCHWGGFGHVEASLKGLRWARERNLDHVTLLTGQCYPLVTLAAIENGLDELDGRSIIDHRPFPMPRWEEGGYNRIDRFHLQAFGRRFALKPWPRHLPAGLQPWGGSSYWSLSREAIAYVLDFLAAYPEVERYFQTVQIPDEVFFQTILASGPLRETLVDAGIHHIEWTLNQPSPHIIGDAKRAMASGKWFTRKVEDLTVIGEIEALRTELPGRPGAPIVAAAAGSGAACAVA